MIVTSSLLLKFCVCVCWWFSWFCQTPYCLSIFRFEEIDEILILPINSTIWRHNNVKLCHCASNFKIMNILHSVSFWWRYHEWFQSYMGGRGEGPRSPPPHLPVAGGTKMPGLNRVRAIRFHFILLFNYDYY